MTSVGVFHRTDSIHLCDNCIGSSLIIFGFLLELGILSLCIGEHFVFLIGDKSFLVGRQGVVSGTGVGDLGLALKRHFTDSVYLADNGIGRSFVGCSFLCRGFELGILSFGIGQHFVFLIGNERFLVLSQLVVCLAGIIDERLGCIGVFNGSDSVYLADHGVRSFFVGRSFLCRGFELGILSFGIGEHFVFLVGDKSFLVGGQLIVGLTSGIDLFFASIGVLHGTDSCYLAYHIAGSLIVLKSDVVREVFPLICGFVVSDTCFGYIDRDRLVHAFEHISTTYRRRCRGSARYFSQSGTVLKSIISDVEQ